jgi:hypothetical protein
VTKDEAIAHVIGEHDPCYRVTSHTSAAVLSAAHEAFHRDGTFAAGRGHSEHESVLARMAADHELRPAARETARGAARAAMASAAMVRRNAEREAAGLPPVVMR